MLKARGRLFTLTDALAPPKRKRVWQTVAVRAAPPAADVELALATLGAPGGQRVICDYPPNALSLNARPPRRVRDKAKRKYRADCCALALQAKLRVPTTDDIRVRLDVFPPDRARRDDDDPIGRFKSGRDGIADAMKVDDQRFRVVPHVHRQPALGCIVFTILEEAPDAH